MFQNTKVTKMHVELSTIFTFAVSIITALGGYKAFELIINKTFNKKKDNCKVTQTTFKIYEEQLEFFKKQLDEQSRKTEELQKQIDALKIENASLKKELDCSCCYNYSCRSRILKNNTK